MSLSKQSIETLLDLVEIKLGCMEVYDREDARELNALEASSRVRPKLVAFPPVQKPTLSPVKAFA